VGFNGGAVETMFKGKKGLSGFQTRLSSNSGIFDQKFGNVADQKNLATRRLQFSWKKSFGGISGIEKKNFFAKSFVASNSIKICFLQTKFSLKMDLSRSLFHLFSSFLSTEQHLY